MTGAKGASSCSGWVADVGHFKNGLTVSLVEGHDSILGIEFRFNPNVLPERAYEGLYEAIVDLVEECKSWGFPTVASDANALLNGQLSIRLSTRRQTTAEGVAEAIIGHLDKLRSSEEGNT
jgi:hypothetical protein